MYSNPHTAWIFKQLKTNSIRSTTKALNCRGLKMTTTKRHLPQFILIWIYCRKICLLSNFLLWFCIQSISCKSVTYDHWAREHHPLNTLPQTIFQRTKISIYMIRLVEIRNFLCQVLQCNILHTEQPFNIY